MKWFVVFITKFWWLKMKINWIWRWLLWMIQLRHSTRPNKIFRWSPNCPLYQLCFYSLSFSYDAAISPMEIRQLEKLIQKSNKIQTLYIIPMPTNTCTINDRMINVALIIKVFSPELYVIINLNWFAFAVSRAISIIPMYHFTIRDLVLFLNQNLYK